MKSNPCESCQRVCHHKFINCPIWQEWAYNENVKEASEDESMGDSEDSNDAINIEWHNHSS